MQSNEPQEPAGDSLAASAVMQPTTAATEQPSIAKPAEVEPYPSPLVGWATVFLLVILYTVSLIDRNLMSLMVPEMKADLGLSDVQIGVLYGAAFAVVYALGTLPFGWALDRYSRRTIVCVGVMIWSIGTAACGLSRNFIAMFASRALVGCGEAVVVPSSQSILPDVFPMNKLALPMSVHAVGAKIGAGASLMVGGLLTYLIPPSEHYVMPVLGEMRGWQLIFIACGLPGLLLAFIIFLVPEPARRATTIKRRGKHATFGDYFRFVWLNRGFIVPHHLALLASSAVTVGISAWAPAYLIRVHGWDGASAGLWLGLVVAVGPTIALPIHGALVDRLFSRGMTDVHLRYLAITLLVATPVGVAAFLVGSPVVSVILIGLFYTIMCGYISLPTTVLQIVIPGDLRGKAAAVQVATTGIFSLSLGPVMVALLTEKVFDDPMKVGQAVALCAAIGIPISALLCWLALKPARALIAARG